MITSQNNYLDPCCLSWVPFNFIIKIQAALNFIFNPRFNSPAGDAGGTYKYLYTGTPLPLNYSFDAITVFTCSGEAMGAGTGAGGSPTWLPRGDVTPTPPSATAALSLSFSITVVVVGSALSLLRNKYYILDCYLIDTLVKYSASKS